MSYSGELIENLINSAEITVTGLDCKCGNPAYRLCPTCDEPICQTHSYDTKGAHKDNGICGECAQIAMLEEYMEVHYGRADA